MADNIYQKLQKMRVDLQGMNIKKSGKNKHMGYEYYELSDILPPINRLMLANKVTAVVTFGDDYAKLRMINCENVEEWVEFSSPMAGVTLKGAHDIQNLGAVETYQRRYLYMTAFEVVESDYFDATQGAPQNQQNQPKQGKAPVKKLSEDMSNKLNEAVTAFSGISGKTSKEILDMIRNETGKTPKTMDDSDGFEVLALIHRWSDEEVEKLGV